MRDGVCWNMAAIGQYVWQISQKEYLLWIKRIPNVCVKDVDWWVHEAPVNASWAWKNICKIKDKLRGDYKNETSGLTRI